MGRRHDAYAFFGNAFTSKRLHGLRLRVQECKRTTYVLLLYKRHRTIHKKSTQHKDTGSYVFA